MTTRFDVFRVTTLRSKRDIEAPRRFRGRQLFGAFEDHTESGVLKFYGWLQQHHPELLPTPKQVDAYQHLKVDLTGLYTQKNEAVAGRVTSVLGSPIVEPKHPNVNPIRDPTLFEMEKLEHAEKLANSLQLERPYSEPGLLLGASAFTAAGWEGSFYPAGMKPRAFLSYYATQFKTVEVDSTYYRTPSASTVTGWYQKTPPDFIFAAKVPQIITHEKVLKDCEVEFDEFIDRMGLLDEKLGPLLLRRSFPVGCVSFCNE